MKNSQYILFDVDGVLIHAENWSSEFIKRNQLPPDAMKVFFGGIFRECTIGKVDLRAILPPFLESWKWEGSIDAFLKAWFDFENHPDLELLAKIQEVRSTGTKCYVATNQEKYRLAYLREKMQFDSLFDGVFCSSEIGLKKPQKEYYEYIVKSLNITPNEILYFDDSLENIEVSRSIDINSLLYRNITDFTETIAACI